MRRYMVFTDKMLNGIVSIDEDHARLVEIVSKLYGVVLESKSAEALAEVFDELKTYTDYHFAHEEELLTKAGYPGLAEHRAGHALMARRLTEYRTQLRDRYDASLAADMLHHLKQWITGHIMTADREASQYLARCGVR